MNEDKGILYFTMWSKREHFKNPAHNRILTGYSCGYLLVTFSERPLLTLETKLDALLNFCFKLSLSLLIYSPCENQKLCIYLHPDFLIFVSFTELKQESDLFRAFITVLDTE